MKFNKQTFTAFTILIIFTLLSACSPQSKTPAPGGTPQGQTIPGTPQNQGQLLSEKTRMNIPNTVQQNLQNAQKRAENIKNHLVKLKNVKKAIVVVSGNTAIVGCKLSPSVKDVNSVKAMIAKKVKAIDKSITNCVVSDSTDITARINKLAVDIANNRKNPAEINNEINRIIQKIKPVT